MVKSNFQTWPSFSNEEIEAVSSVLRSNRVNYWTGQEAREFEREFAAWSETSHAIAVMNGTVALDLALAGLGIGSHNGGSAEDEVVVTPRTFMASVSTVVNAGAIPVFADVDLDSGNITAKTISDVVSPNTQGIIAVHLAGWPCDMASIMQLAEAGGIKVIEDCAQAHGARYKGRSVGSFGHVAAWSFCQDKIMTTGGEGGMVTTNDQDLWSRMWSHKDHGKSWDAVYERGHSPGFRWLHESFGTNWRMLEMQAVIGRIQLRRMESWTASRERNAMRLRDSLVKLSKPTGPVRLPKFSCAGCQSCSLNEGCRHAQYKYYVYLRTENLSHGWTRDRIVAEVSKEGIPCFQGSCPEVYLERAFDNTGWRPQSRLPVAKELGETSLMFLVHPTLKEADITKTIDVVTEVLERASK